MTNRTDSNTDVVTRDEIDIALANKTVKGILSRVFKIFLVAFNKGKIPVWNKLMDDYVNDPSNNIPNDRAKQTSAKGNIKREFLGSQLSWPKFCAAFRFAQFSKLEIIFKLTDKNNNSMYIKEDINFENLFIEDEEEDPVNAHIMTESPYGAISEYGQNAVSAAKSINTKQMRVPTNSWIKKPITDSQVAEVDKIIQDSTVK